MGQCLLPVVLPGEGARFVLKWALSELMSCEKRYEQ